MKLSAKTKNLHIKRILSVLLVAVLFVAPLAVPAALSAAEPTAQATSILRGLGAQDAPQRPATMGLEITGQIPTAQTGSSRLNAALEERWTAQYNNFVQNHMAGALSIDSQPEFFTSYVYVSTAFTKEAVSVSTTASISTTVIDSRTNTIITLTDFNVNIVQLVNSHINNLVDGRAHNFSGIDANHPFYLDGDRLVIPFGSAELFPNERGIYEVVLSISNIEEETFPDYYFRILEPNQYNTVMVRVADVMRKFGYAADWDGETRTARIWADAVDGTLVSSLTIGENSYSYRDGRTRELEVAPMLFDGLTYVPLSFFNEVVGIPTTVSSDGVTVSRYISGTGTGGSSSSISHGLLVE